MCSGEEECSKDPVEHAAMVLVLAYKYMVMTNEDDSMTDDQIIDALKHATAHAYGVKQGSKVWAGFVAMWNQLCDVWTFDALVKENFPDAPDGS